MIRSTTILLYKIFAIGLALVCLPSVLQAQSIEDWTFQTLPENGNIVGSPGEGIGWGYSITNQSSDRWLWVDSVSASGPFQHAVASSDIFDQPVLAPGQSVSLAYDGTQGLYRMVWDADAPKGFTNSGTFTLTAGWYTGDPFDSVSPGSYIGDAGIKIATYHASTVPAPSALIPMTLGSGGLLFGAWKRSRRSKA